MSNRTAAVSKPYLCPPENRGLKILQKEEMLSAVSRVHARGFQIAVHSQGDDGLGDTLDAFESVLGPNSHNPLRHRIEHAGCLFLDLLRRAAAMGIGVSSQPVFIPFLGDGYIEAFGPRTAYLLYPHKSMLTAGIPLGGSSDCPVSPLDPRLGLAAAVMRTSSNGNIIGAQEALSMQEALEMFTHGSAWLAFEENIAGTLAPGKRADFTVFGTDPCLLPPEQVPDLPVNLTMVGGRATLRI